MSSHCRRMLSVAWAGSISVRLASRESVNFFFQEVVLDLETPNLFIELGLQGSVLVVGVRILSCKDVLSTIEQLSFPGADLVGVDAETLSQDSGGVAAFEGFEGDFGFELGRVLSSLCHGS